MSVHTLRARSCSGTRGPGRQHCGGHSACAWRVQWERRGHARCVHLCNSRGTKRSGEDKGPLWCEGGVCFDGEKKLQEGDIELRPGRDKDSNTHQEYARHRKTACAKALGQECVEHS